jgi:spermidine/putrescine-binding protein
MDDPAIYMLQTSVGYWDYNVIMKNSEVKEGAMVVCNAMLEPEQQMIAFETTGNGYNIDLSKLDSADKAAFEDLIADMGTLSPTSTEITEQSYADKYGKVAAWIASGWDAKVNRA